MQGIRTIMTVFSILGMLYTPVSFAQQRETLPGQNPTVPPGLPGASQPAKPQATGTAVLPIPKASTFIGSAVVNRQGESLGKIEDLVIDLATGSITYVALSHGSILGMGGKLFAVAWKSMELQPDGTFILNLSRERLESASGFDKNNWPRRPDSVLSMATRGPETGMSPPSTATGVSPGVSATVQTVNVTAETITLKTEHGESVDLRAPAAMLAHLQAGDNVEVKMVGARATDIQKKEKKE
jgi:sporulation protein YlmC with PRC-barrel domain